MEWSKRCVESIQSGETITTLGRGIDADLR